MNELTGTASNGVEVEPFTLEKLKQAVETLPKILGYAVIVASSLVTDKIYTLPMPKESKYLKMIVVPQVTLDKIIAEFVTRRWIRWLMGMLHRNKPWK